VSQYGQGEDSFYGLEEVKVYGHEDETSKMEDVPSSGFQSTLGLARRPS
jgi:hypothetical protein